jgi:DNA-nicking Smr family endonuclease
MTQKNAHVAINNFIEVSYLAGKRCVLIITGKGLKIGGGVGVLRLAVPRWLNEKPNRSRVLAFSYATPKDGGEGALYIMLKKKR